MCKDRVGLVRLLSGGAALCALLTQCQPADAQFGRRGGQSPGGMGTRQSSSTSPRRPAPYYRPQTDTQVTDVHITGNQAVATEKIRSHLKTRSDRVFDPALVQEDVRALYATGLFRDVRTYTKQERGGISVTFEVFERPTIGFIHFVGNRKVKDKVLLRESGLKDGDALNSFSVTEGRRRIEEYYRTHGYTQAQVSIIEGDKPEHQGVAYRIHEGPLQRIFHTRFIGNTIASDRRLRTQIQSKPGILWLFKGKVDYQTIDEDVDRLEAYYRSLGFFRAKIGRELQFDNANKWLTVTFTIKEGPRYRVRDVRMVGGEKYAANDLAARLELKPGDYFNLATLRRDENTLRDIYGSEGHILANIQAEPRFLEQPGHLDLVFKIEEGDQYRVGRVSVNIAGDHAHTRRTVVLNRLSLRPGDIVDIREVRSSERRLKASQLFMNDPIQGITPQIVVKPSDLSDLEAAAVADEPTPRPGRGVQRGQSPHSAERFAP